LRFRSNAPASWGTKQGPDGIDVTIYRAVRGRCHLDLTISIRGPGLTILVAEPSKGLQYMQPIQGNPDLRNSDAGCRKPATMVVRLEECARGTDMILVVVRQNENVGRKGRGLYAELAISSNVDDDSEVVRALPEPALACAPLGPG
jgi:hypothetical protein